MTYQIGLMLAFGAVALVGLLLTIFRINPRDDREGWREFTEHQRKDLRRDELRRCIAKDALRKAEALRWVENLTRPLKSALEQYDAIAADRRALAREVRS